MNTIFVVRERYTIRNGKNNPKGTNMFLSVRVCVCLWKHIILVPAKIYSTAVSLKMCFCVGLFSEVTEMCVVEYVNAPVLI